MGLIFHIPYHITYKMHTQPYLIYIHMLYLLFLFVCGLFHCNFCECVTDVIFSVSVRRVQGKVVLLFSHSLQIFILLHHTDDFILSFTIFSATNTLFVSFHLSISQT